MKNRWFSLSAAKTLVLVTALGICLPVSAAALFTLKGNTPEAKLESESEVRLSLLGWTADAQTQVVADEFQRYLQSHDHDAFRTFLQNQDTKGYLFTKEATGHTIKYAWEETNADSQRMVLLVTPALKTRNPYMWKQPNNDPAPFSLLEVRFRGDEAVVKTSLSAPVSVNAQGRLELQDYAGAAEYATLRDDTPYYLKNSG